MEDELDGMRYRFLRAHFGAAEKTEETNGRVTCDLPRMFEGEPISMDKRGFDNAVNNAMRKAGIFYDPTFGDDRRCECSHPYYRHFDPYEHNYPVGCKYCPCFKFKEAA